MYSQISSGFILFLVLITGYEAAKRYVPKVDGSYRAVGEIIIPNPNGEYIQLTFEENYDKSGHTTALWISAYGSNSTIQENLLPGMNQSFLFDTFGGTCSELSTGDWESSGMGMKAFDVKGQVVFPLRQLLSLNEDNLDKNGWGRDTVIYRGVRANYFTFNVTSKSDTLIIDAYWSDGQGASTMSKMKEIPLGFKITRIIGPRTPPEVHNVNIYSFTHDEFNTKMLEPIRGIYCPGRRDPVKFPDLSRYTSMAISTEFIWAENTLITAIDTWIDLEKMILRADLEPLQTLSGLDANAETIIFDLNRDMVYHMHQDGSRGCNVNTLKDETYFPQLIIDPREKENWDAQGFFGTKNNNFIRIGKTTERSIPCDIYQAERKDWPPGENNITSVWEWCFANDILPEIQLPDDQLPLVSLTIYVTESPYEFGTPKKPHKGQKMAYRFYNTRKMAPSYMEALAFDISSCFDDIDRMELYFEVQLSDKDKEIVQKMKNLTEFDSRWRTGIIIHSGLGSDTLRITKTRATFQYPKTGPLLVEFTLLGRHKKLPDFEAAVTIDKAFTDLQKAIDAGIVAILWEQGNQILSLKARKGSLKSSSAKSYRSESPAFPRLHASMAKYEEENKPEPSGHSPLVYLAVGVASLQVGAAIGVAVVAIKRRRSQNAAANQ